MVRLLLSKSMILELLLKICCHVFVFLVTFPIVELWKLIHMQIFHNILLLLDILCKSYCKYINNYFIYYVMLMHFFGLCNIFFMVFYYLSNTYYIKLYYLMNIYHIIINSVILILIRNYEKWLMVDLLSLKTQ